MTKIFLFVIIIDEAIQLNQYKNTGKIIKYKGKIYPSYVEIARVFDVDYDTFRRRMERGWSIDEALDPQLKKTSLILKKEQK